MMKIIITSGSMKAEKFLSQHIAFGKNNLLTDSTNQYFEVKIFSSASLEVKYLHQILLNMFIFFHNNLLLDAQNTAAISQLLGGTVFYK